MAWFRVDDHLYHITRRAWPARDRQGAMDLMPDRGAPGDQLLDGYVFQPRPQAPLILDGTRREADDPVRVVGDRHQGGGSTDGSSSPALTRAAVVEKGRPQGRRPARSMARPQRRTARREDA